MNEFNLIISDLEYMQNSLVTYPPIKWRWLVIERGKTIGQVIPLSPSRGVIVIYPSESAVSYEPPLIFRCAYKNFVTSCTARLRGKL